MKKKIIEFKDTAKSFWTDRSKNQKGILIGSAAIVAALALAIILFSSDSEFVPLYNDLSVQEVSQIKEELDSRGVPYELKNGGKTIEVPGSDVDSLLVDLAGQGIPNSGNIDYSFFSENASWGITDNEFSMIKLDAMQSELATLIQGVEGIDDAEVMINMPEEPVFVSDSKQEASASIVIHTDPGHHFQGNQINSLYHMVSKAVPNLNEENIAIMNQYFEYYDQDSPNGINQENTYTYQQNVKKDIEKDVQQRLQQMLGAMVGMENVIVSVTADIDFTEENRVEELVEPVDVENMEGLPVSIESVEETYEGNPPVGGEGGTGDEDIPTYEAAQEGGNGEYESSKETINNEYNRVRKEITESPYKVRDLGIQVAVDEVKGEQDGDVQYLSAPEQETVSAGIASILDSIISTTIDGEYDGDIEPEEKTSIVFQEFSESIGSPQASSPVIPLWMYIAGGALLVIIIVLIILLLRSRKASDEENITEETVSDEPEITAGVSEIDDVEESESERRRKQLEKLANDNPEDFAKLLRSWIADD
ncbi:flagellar basal-body MS-ring/collar protein FliF [Lentibacillus salicampi]|uniref:Flagellar M-ring protein n=1 Tax=Lentibacillus salicampi TaxID=175306 RepID=A0A4Y9AH26_9BACI|nr:flagellar basal-body MS-ring/collar protein FliF [Lentibacillus salicampi]TFJ94662.1 flagellar basal body M-ring protein FliF [Lentibacillus salicampi]